MTLEQKMNYIIGVLNKITEGSKDIGELEVYSNQSNEANYIPIYSTVDKKTRRVNIDQLIQDLGDGLPIHGHEYYEINGIGDFKVISSDDTNGNPWRVERVIDDETTDAFKLDDRISGWNDANKTIYYEGIVLDNTISIPADLDNSAKFFILTKKHKV